MNKSKQSNVRKQPVKGSKVNDENYVQKVYVASVNGFWLLMSAMTMHGAIFLKIKVT